MGLTLTIGGVDALDYLEPGPGNPGLDAALQARTVFRMVLKDRSGVYRPIIRQEVIAELDSVRIFGGVITAIDEGDFGDYVGNLFTVECNDWTQVLDTLEFNGIVAGVTLKDVLQALVTVRLASRGFSVDPTMAAGPVIGAQGYSFRYVSDVLNELGSITSWPWTVDAFKQIKFAPADGRPAPFALTATNDTVNSCRVATSIDGYVNVVWLHYGAGGERDMSQEWIATTGQIAFPITSFPNPEGITRAPDVVLINPAPGDPDPFREYVGDATQPWTWRASDGTLLRNAAGITLLTGDRVVTSFVANFPAAIVEADATEVGLYGEAAYVERVEDIFDVDQARAVAQGILRDKGGLLRKLAITTHTPGLQPGHVVPVDLPERNISEDCLVLSSRMVLDGLTADGDEWWRFDLDLIEGTAYRETWQRFFRDVSRQSSGASVSASGSVGPPPGSGGGGGGSAPPLPSSAVYRYLGGSRSLAGFVPAAASDDWRSIPQFVDAFVDFDAIGLAYAQVTVNVRTRDAAITVTARVVTVDGAGVRALVLATGTPVGSTDWVYQGIPLPARTGLSPIRVEFKTSVRDRDAFVANAQLDVF